MSSLDLPTLKVALVGCRNDGITSSYLKLQSSSPTNRGFHIHVTSLCARPKYLKRARKMFDGVSIGQPPLPPAPPRTYQYDTLSELLSDIDVVDVDVPADELSEVLIQCFAAGKPVLSGNVRTDFHNRLPSTFTTTTPTSSSTVQRHLHCVVESWAYKPIVLRIAEMLDAGVVGRCLGYAMDISMSLSADGLWEDEAVSGTRFIRALRVMFGDVTSVEGTMAAHNTNDRVALLHGDRDLKGVLRIETVAREDQRSRSQLCIHGDNDRDLVWDMSTNILRIIEISSKEVKAVEKVPGDHWLRGGRKDAVLDALCHVNSSIHSIASLGNKSTSGGNRHNEAGRPDHRCSRVEAAKDALVMDTILKLRSGINYPKNILPAADAHAADAHAEQPVVVNVSSNVLTNILEPVYQPLHDVSRSRYQSPSWVARCSSIRNVQDVLKWSQKNKLDVKAVGCGHSWSDVGEVKKGGVLIDTRAMIRVQWCQNGVVCVQPGATVRNLTKALAARGLCIPSLPVLLRQTIGGAVSTGSHGSSLHYGTLSDFVSSVVIVTLDGERVRVLLQEDDEHDDNNEARKYLSAARMGLGNVGVLVEIRLHVSKMYHIVRSEDMINMKHCVGEKHVGGGVASGVVAGVERIVAMARSSEHCWVHWPVGGDHALCLRLHRCENDEQQGQKGNDDDEEEEEEGEENIRCNDNNVIVQEIYDGRNWFPLITKAGNDLLNLEKQQHTGGMVCLSMQYAFPLDGNFSNVVNTVANVALLDGHQGRILELKFMKFSNKCMLGYNNTWDVVDDQHDVGCINLWWPLATQGAKDQLCQVEQAMKDAGGRPHFGKYHTCTTTHLKTIIPRMSTFEKLTSPASLLVPPVPSIALDGAAFSPPNPMTNSHYLCYVTNGAYAPGAVCLAQSLALVGSRGRLRVIATSIEAKEALEIEASLSSIVPPMDIVFELNELPVYESDKTHNGRGATLAVDAPRRCLYDDSRDGWILLDADLLAISNPDQLFEILNNNDDDDDNNDNDDGGGSSGGDDADTCTTTTTTTATIKKDMYATGNFRIKKKRFGTLKEGGNFNAGMMVVPRPLTSDGKALQSLVNEADEDDTEELLMNDLFKGRCGDLARGYNVPKRVMQHAPLLWREMIDNEEMIFLHYMGAKPWMKNIKQRQNADWESERPSYKELEKLWWKVRRGEAALKNGTLHHLLPTVVNKE